MGQHLEIPPKFSLIFVLGVARSGSTLLGRILDMHSQVLCVGELLRIGDAIEKDFRCSCGQKIEVCDFWRQHIGWIKKENGLHFRRFTPEVYKKLCDLSGKKIAVDLSKTRVLRMFSSLLGLGKSKFKKAGFVLLLRDPKGVSASSLRHSDKTLDKFLRRYLKWMTRFQKLADKEGDRVHVLKYEDLCERPKIEIMKLCSFIGVEYEPRMMTPSDKMHHLVHSSSSGYMKNVNALVVDERWRTELGVNDIKKIEKVTRKISILKDAYTDK